MVNRPSYSNRNLCATTQTLTTQALIVNTKNRPLYGTFTEATRSFKLEFGKASRFSTLDRLIEGIGQHIFYYNTKRIHSALKMPPQRFHLEYLEWMKAHFNAENPGL